MPLLANSYRATRILSQDGMSITDAFYTDGNRRRPITLKKVGEVIDLKRVDIRSFVRSSVNGQIRSLFINGTLAGEQVEVDDVVEAQIRQALGEAAVHLRPEAPLPAQNVKHVLLEPGLNIMVGDMPDPRPDEVIFPLPGEEQKRAAPPVMNLEPGVIAPDSTVMEVPAKETKKKKSSKKEKAEEAAGEEQTPEDSFLSWKLNKDFQTQKNEILSSEDKEFLKMVAEKDDSLQFKKLAQARLAELNA